MTTFRGVDAFLALGGHLDGNAQIKLAQAEIAGATVVTLNASVSLTGVVATGDTFTIAAEAGGPTHTVTGGPYFAQGGSIGPISFTTAIGAGGVAQNAAVTFGATSIVEAKAWTLRSSVDTLDTTVFGTSGYKIFRAGLVEWDGTGEANLDYADLKQKALIDSLSGGAPAISHPAIMFGVLPGAATVKQFYGAVALTQMQVTAQVGSLVTVTYSFKGSGTLAINWNP